MKAIVLSNQKQFKKFEGLRLSPNEALVFCDNERLYAFLKDRNLRFEKLDEFLLKDQWEEINQWGIGNAAEWIRICRDKGHFNAYDYPSVIFLWFSVLLISAVKNFLYVRHMVEKYKIDEFYFFDGEVDEKYPELAGNVTLNYFIRDVATMEGFKIHLLDLCQVKEPLFESASIATKLKRFMRSVVQKIYGAAIRPRRGYEVMAFGTLRHLASTMLQLKKSGCKICFYDDQFHFEHLCFSIKAGIPYFLPSCFSLDLKAERESSLRGAAAEMVASLVHPDCANLFLYKTYNFKNFIKKKIFGTMDDYLVRLSKEEAIYRQATKALGFTGVLLDEDFNAHSFFAEFMKRSDVKNFCISHASYAIDCIVPEKSRCFSQSYTFVLGEHEKDAYVDRGWDPTKIVVTGTPRYDRLVSLTSNPPAKTDRITRVLFCGAFLWPYSPDALNVIGCDIYTYRYFQVLALRTLLRAARDLPLSIIVKPHYSEDEALWKDFVKDAQPNCQVRVTKASEDFSDLLAQCNAMVLCAWSATLMEAGIARVPVFYVDSNQLESRQVNLLKKCGLCHIVQNAFDLEMALKSLCERKSLKVEPRKLSSAQEYYLGDLSGQASSRVAKFILKQIRGEDHVPA